MAIDPHNLPEGKAALHQIVLQLLQVVEDKDRLLERVQRQLEQLLRQRYGPKRERIDETQLFMFAAQIVAASQAVAEPTVPDSGTQETPASDTSQAKHRGHGRKPLPASLERKRVVFDLEESKGEWPEWQTGMRTIGEDGSERVEFIPASLQVIEEVRPKYACAKGCGVVAASKPAMPIEKGLPGPGLLAQV